MTVLETLQLYWAEITAWMALASVFLMVLTIAWILTIKRDPMSALAWCLLVIFLPLVGMLLFVLLGYQQVQQPLSRKVRHKKTYRRREASEFTADLSRPAEPEPPADGPQTMARLAQRFDAYPLTA